jgi:hypothetical protein
MKYGQFSSPFGIVDPPHLRDLSYFEFSLYEAILGAMSMVCISWEELSHGLCFLPF